MFNKDFFPTPENIIQMMLNGHDIKDKTILEPSAGKGNIVDYLLSNGAGNVIACENNEDLRKILATKCSLIGDDFLKLTSDKISHIDFIVMNPPFSADDKHILHAWNIAPPACKIIALCNLATVENQSYKDRQTLGTIIESYGNFEDLGQCFEEAERRTGVEVAMITLTKPGQNENAEFEGFFMGEDPTEQQENGIMPYNVIRDLVQRYVEAVKLFDKQLTLGVEMNNLTDSFYSSSIAFHCTEGDKMKTKNEFKKDLQKSGWKFVFDKMNMNKYTTKGLREDINKFVEKQTQIPFTMQNIYKMIEIVIGTTEQRMDKALLEVFDKLTEHYNENRYNVEGWKTNSHYLINEKFIMPYLTKAGYSGQMESEWGGREELINDVVKALCYLTGTNYENCTTFREFISKNKCEWGKWYSWAFFEIRGYKKGTTHFKFNSVDLWGKFNQRIAKLKGYPLYEAVKTKETPKREAETAKRYKPTILETIKI